MTDDLINAIDELAGLQLQQERIKSRMDKIKAYLEQQATAELADTKSKTISYFAAGAAATATIAESVKPASVIMLQQLLGPVASEWIREKVTYEMTDPCKRLMGAIANGSYTAGTLEDAIDRITDDPDKRRLLAKKLKGKYDKDLATLQSVVGLSGQDATDWAYLIAEIVNYQRFLRVLEAAEYAGSTDEAIQIVKSAVIVDETVKVAVVPYDTTEPAERQANAHRCAHYASKGV